ncbi:UPF0158 family protein [Planococcus sp. FY231025]|uniref:UPF0158 family protein n=1 Tax=Planococcus sp. FY231025 TaxID=3455699 RepID=UPI003F92F64A
MKLIDELADQYLIQTEEFQSMLNVKTGEIIFEPKDPFEDEFYDEDEDDTEYDDEFEMDEEVEAADDLIIIPEFTSPEAYEAREMYARQLPDTSQRKKLLESLQRKKPFQQFRNQLDALDLTEDWYKFEQEFAKERIVEWLKEEGLYEKIVELEKTDGSM